MKHVIMFKGGVETLEFFSVEISRYLPEDEYDVFWYDLFMSESSFVHLLEIYNAHTVSYTHLTLPTKRIV